MANFLEQSIYTYTGLSTETKPSTAGGDTIPNGSRWREVDTEKVWYYNQSDDTWYLGNTRIDQSTHAIETIDYAHHEIHSGSSFTVHFDNITTNNDDHRTAIGFQCPNNAKWAHMTIAISSSLAAEFFIYEAPTITLAEGTEIVIFNRNRNSTNVSTVVDLANPQVAGKVTTFIEAQLATLAGGTTLDHYQLVGGEGPKAVGGVARGAQELILDQGAKYMMVMQNVGANINLHEIHMDWYEHTDKA